MNVAASTPTAFKEILVATDFTDASTTAVAYAAAIAKRFAAHIELVHVSEPVNPIAPPEGEWFENALARTAEQVEAAGNALREMGIRATAVNPTGSIKREIVSLAKTHSADLVVLGTHGSKGLDRMLFGSQAEDVARSMPCPVIIVGPQAKPAPVGPWSPKRLMCAVSGKTELMKIVEYAYLLSRILGGKLKIFTVSTAYQEQVETFMGKISRELPDVDVEIVQKSANVEGEPAATIVAFARESNADLLIMESTESHHSVSHFPRGVLPEVFASASCPVLTLNLR